MKKINHYNGRVTALVIRSEARLCHESVVIIAKPATKTGCLTSPNVTKKRKLEYLGSH